MALVVQTVVHHTLVYIAMELLGIFQDNVKKLQRIGIV